MPRQEFKVSPIRFISPDEKNKGGPVFMEKTTEDISQRTKEIVLTSRPGPGCPVPLIPQIQNRVKQKRRQVQQAKVRARMVLPMPKVMLKVVSMILQHIIMLVLYLPPRPPAVRRLLRVSLVYPFVRYPTVVIRPFSRILVLYAHFQIIDQNRFPDLISASLGNTRP
jgi:hypothetical protein